MDNKGTGKCYLLIAFMEWIVCELKILKTFRIIFLLKGHSVTVQDVSNEPVSTIFFSSKGHDWLIQPSEVSLLVNEQSKDHTARVISDFFNWKESLIYDESVITYGLSDVQIFLTKNDHPTGPGTMFYETVDRENKEINPRGPFCILRRAILPPSRLSLPQLKPSIVEHLKDFKVEHPNLKSESAVYLDNVINGGNGVEASKLVFPDFILRAIPTKNTDPVTKDEPIAVAAKDEAASSISANSQPKETLKKKIKFFNHKFDNGMVFVFLFSL